MNGPNLSEYFSNNPPSLFDDILKNEDTSLSGISSNLINTAPNVMDDASNYFGSLKSLVPDEVVDFWEPPVTEAGIPPMLTMPGVQLSSNVVNIIKNKIFIEVNIFTHSFVQSWIQYKKLLSIYLETQKLNKEIF